MSTFACPVVTISKITKHPNADALDILEFTEVSWTCVDKLGAHKPGDTVVYIPIDSNVDVSYPQFEFLKPRAKSNGLARIRTIKLRQQLSQGLIVDIPEGNWKFKVQKFMHYLFNGSLAGLDCADALGITKYEPPQERVFAPNAKGAFPAIFVKSDAERYQNYHRSIEPFLQLPWHATVKIDGTSLTVFYNSKRVGEELGVCSRTQELKPPDKTEGGDSPTRWGFSIDIYWKAAIEYNLLEKVKQIAELFKAEAAAVQCELAGPGIQGNKLGLSEVTPFAFDIQIVKDGKHFFLDADIFFQTCKQLHIRTVPLYKTGTFLEITENTGVTNNRLKFDFIEKLVYDNKTPIEGLVFVTSMEKHHGTLGRVKVKYINPTFLLKQKEEE